MKTSGPNYELCSDELRPAIVMLKDEVNSPDHATKLKEAGLSGKPLQLTLGILNRREEVKDTGTAKFRGNYLVG